MNFIGYTYKADVESEKVLLVNVLKDLDVMSEQDLSGSGGSDQKN